MYISLFVLKRGSINEMAEKEEGKFGKVEEGGRV